jgi:hypothetical protein
MPIQSEEILARLALDATSLDAGTRLALDKQKKYSMEYTGFWNDAMAKREAAEAASNERSLAKLKAFDDAKLAEQARFFERQAAMYAEKDAVAAVGQGSVPQGWASKAEHAAEGAAAFGAGAMAGRFGRGEKEAKEAKEAATAEKEVGSLRHAGHALRELAHLIGELTGLTIAVRVLRSVATALRAIAMVGAGAVSVIVAGAAAIGGNLWMRKQVNEMGGESKESVETRLKQHRNLTAYIKNLEKSGTLDDKTAKDMLYRIRGGDTESLIGTQRRLMKMFPHGTSGIGGQEADISRAGMNPDQIWDADTMALMKVQAEMQGMDKNTPIYRQKKAEHEKLLKKQDEDSKAIAKWTSGLKKAEGERASLTAEQEGQGRVYPTLADLAKINSPQGRMAQQIFALRKDQLSQRETGNVAWANWDASQSTRLQGVLQSQGAIAPDRHSAEIKSHLATLNSQITALKDGIQKVVITGVDGY